MTFVCTLSAGEGSWRAAKITRAEHPDEDLRLLFTDTLLEDADAYRFLLEGAADIVGRKLDWIPDADDFPDYRVSENVAIEDYCGNAEWRAFLAGLRAMAAVELPELVWLVEGRDPWEIYRDERFIGNSRIDPCSKILKRQMLDRWREANCDPERDIIVFGIGADERHRFEGSKKSPGLRARLAEKGWRAEAPLIAHEDAGTRLAMLVAPISVYGLARPRLYGLGYVHNNCGGFCCKAGKAHFQNRWRVHPERFAYDAMMERKLRAYLKSSTASVMFDRHRGSPKKHPLTLDEFGARLAEMERVRPQFSFEYEEGSSGCGCAVDYDEDDDRIAA